MSNAVNYSNGDPRTAHTFSEFILAGNEGNVINYDKICFKEFHDNTHFIVKNILDDYLWEFKHASLKCKLSTEEFQKYQYNPKRLCSDLYGTTEVYFVILAINDMASVRDFDKKILYLMKKDDMNSYLTKIYTSEHKSIEMYNNDNDNEDE